MKYTAVYNKRANRWFPRSLNNRTVTTEQLCEEVSDSTVSAGDVLAVLRTLHDAMKRHLCAGDKVKLDNIGTFYLMAGASKNGVATEEEVTANQFNKVNVRFTPQKVTGLAGQKNVPALAAGTIRWERATSGSTAGTPSGSGGGNGGTTPTPDSGGDEG